MDEPAKAKSGTQDRGKRHWLNKKTVQKMLLQVSRILERDEKAEQAQKLSDKDRLHYLNTAVHLARILGERDKQLIKASKLSPFN